MFARAHSAGAAHLRDPRCRVGRAGAARRSAAARHARGTCASRTCRSATTRFASVLRNIDIDARARPDDRAARADRLRQVDDRQPASPLLRRDGRADHHRRSRHPRRHAEVAARCTSASSSRTSSSSSTRIRDNIAYGRPDATDEEIVRGGAGRPDPRVHRAAARRLRHLGRRARCHALRRPAAARRDRADAAPRPEGADLRRLHGGGGHAHRVPHPGGARAT